jgi:elongation factor Ts
MQVAALRAPYLSREDVPAEVLEAERRVLEEKTRAEGKPEQAVAKIVEGRLNAFFADNVLLEQESVREQKKTVKQVLDEAGVTVTKFAHFEIGR